MIGLFSLIFFPLSLSAQSALIDSGSDFSLNFEHEFLSTDIALATREAAIVRTVREHVQSIPQKDRNVRKIFNWLRSSYFLEYTAVATLGETLREGQFNCVSSTALTALALDAADIPFRIEETPRHVFLYAQQNETWLRVETTSDERAIFRSSRRDDEWTRDISVRQLAGLQAYNEGLQALDQSNYNVAFAQFAQAHQLYPDTRIYEMLEHTARKESRIALRLVRKGQFSKAQPHLENALQVLTDDALLHKSFAAILLNKIESNSSHTQNLTVLESAMHRHSFLSAVIEIRQVHSDLLLAVAWENFKNDACSSGLARLNQFEEHYASAHDVVQTDMAGAVYSQGWKSLVRVGDEKGAEALLQRGLIFAPESASLSRKRDAMAIGGNWAP